MLTLKQKILRVFFVLEIIVFLCVYCLGAHGIRLMRQLQQENSALVTEIQQLTTNVQKLERDIMAWDKEPFLKEKFAREHLQMARKDELIFYVNNTSV